MFQLPSEILNKIASYTQNRYECLKVCHSWLTSFQPCLYQHVHITTRRQFKQFVQTINDHLHLGIHVQHLYIEYHVGITRDEFEILDFYFPLLQSLDFNPKLWKYQRKTGKKNWKRIAKLPPLDRISLNLQLLQYYGQSLTDLTLSGSLVNQLHIHGSKLIPLFQSTPHLKRLRMFGRDKLNAITISDYTQTEFTLKNILDLHSLLPVLEELELLDVVLALLVPESKYVSFPCIRKFRVQGKLAHYKWVALVAQLYPNVENLELNISWDEAYKQTLTHREFQAVKTGLIHIAKTCRYLETIRLVSLGGVIKNAHQIFYQTLSKNNKGLLNIDGVMVSSLMELKYLANDILQCCDSENTHTLRLQLWRDLGSIENIMIPISQCHQLKELELNCGKFSYSWNYGCDIDTIARYCPQLKVFKLTMTRMTVGKKYKEGYSRVESIELNQVHFTTESMDALSVWFPNLKHLRISNCVKDRDHMEQKISINLYNQTLETLMIEKIYLRSSQYIEKSTIDSALFAIDFIDRKIRKENRLGKIDMTRWYHLYNQKRGGTRQLKRLNSSQSNQLQSYKMKEQDWDCLEEGSIRGTYREFKYWENDIPFGYIHITCNLIHHLVINKVLV